MPLSHGCGQLEPNDRRRGIDHPLFDRDKSREARTTHFFCGNRYREDRFRPGEAVVGPSTGFVRPRVDGVKLARDTMSETNVVKES